MKKATPFVIYALSMLGSGLGFMIQILVSGYWSTAFSQDVTFYSVNLAFYFLSMGIGTRVCEHMPKRPSTLWLQVGALALCCGLCIPLLRWTIGRFNEATPLAVLVVCAAGVIAGGILPTAIKLFPGRGQARLGTLFFVDYMAAIFFSLLFTFGLLIPLGYTRSGLCLSLGSFAALGVLAATTRAWNWKQLAPWAFAACLPLYWTSRSLQTPTQAPDHREAQIVHSEQSHYQKIIVTELNDAQGTHNTLYLDGFVQFHSDSEQLYHFCLANLPVAAAESMGQPVRRVLILGGGDGLVARNLLAFPSVQNIDMVELDPAMIRLARMHPALTRHNLQALDNPKVQVHIADAFTWVRDSHQTYDLILLDLPSPKNLSLARLFSAEFYTNVAKRLAPDGFMAVQAGPYYAPPPERAVSTITAGVRKAVGAVLPHTWVYLTSRDADAFVLATRAKTFSMQTFAKGFGIEPGARLAGVCRFDPHAKIPVVSLNTLNTLPLAGDAHRWYRAVKSIGFFDYRASHALFLPE